MPYDPNQAVQYAALWWNDFNPLYRSFSNDCTNFISQCLFTGGWPMAMSNRRDEGWWYRGPNEQWSYSWAVAHSLRWYMDTSGRTEPRRSARELELGDVISYDFNGDGVWQHVALIVGYDRSGEPLVAAHSLPSWGRLWTYADSPAYTPNTQYLFRHIKP